MDVHLIDGTYELFRHFFAVPAMADMNGQEIGAVRGVLTSVVSMIERGATHIGVATDHVVESFRNDLYPGYKTSEGVAPELLSQFPVLEEALEARRGAEEGSVYKPIRRGWFLGDKSLKQKLLAHVAGKAGEHHYGEELRESAERGISFSECCNTVTLDSYGVTLPEKQVFGTYAAKLGDLQTALDLMATGRVDPRQPCYRSRIRTSQRQSATGWFWSPERLVYQRRSRERARPTGSRSVRNRGGWRKSQQLLGNKPDRPES